jgi:hypothetical protein
MIRLTRSDSDRAERSTTKSQSVKIWAAIPKKFRRR